MSISRLFNIDPIGVGTPYVESLPSYIKRLAEAHSVLPGILLKHEILSEPSDYRLKVLSISNELLLSISSDFIRALEIKTNNNNIHNLSLTKLSDYIDKSYLLRDNAAWCPRCYEEARKYNEPIYEQLIWYIKDINICGKHLTKLHQICPHCHKQFKTYGPLGRVGYCYHCNHWLGNYNEDYYSYSELKNFDIWAFDNIGSILSNIPKLSLSDESCLSKNISEILEFTGFSQQKLGDRIAVTSESIHNWIIGSKKPPLSSVLLLSYKFGLHVSELLFEKINSNNININIKNLKVEPRPEKPNIDFNELQLAIKKALTSAELISITSLAKKNGVKLETIKRHFPREYHLLIQKNKRQKEETALRKEEQIREKMIALNEKGKFPSISRVTHGLGIYSKMSERYRKTWESTLRELGYSDEIDSG